MMRNFLLLPAAIVDRTSSRGSQWSISNAFASLHCCNLLNWYGNEWRKKKIAIQVKEKWNMKNASKVTGEKWSFYINSSVWKNESSRTKNFRTNYTQVTKTQAMKFHWKASGELGEVTMSDKKKKWTLASANSTCN